MLQLFVVIEVKRCQGAAQELQMLPRCQSLYVVQVCTTVPVGEPDSIYMELCAGTLMSYIRGKVARMLQNACACSCSINRLSRFTVGGNS